MDVVTCSSQSWLENEQFWKEQLQNEKFWESIPLISTSGTSNHESKDNVLVRFRGMVQDMYDPEYYCEQYEIENLDTNVTYMRSGKYSDSINLAKHEKVNFESSKNVTSERQTVVLISLPCLNMWAQQIETEQNELLYQNRDVEVSTCAKRQMEEDEENMETETVDNKNKRICISNVQSSSNTNSSIVSQEHILNLPIPDSTGKCCHLKVYENWDSIKLNNMLEIIGFLSVNPLLTDVSSNKEIECAMELQTHNPPPSLVPRIHCVAFRRIEHCNPLVKQITLSNEVFSSLREELSILLTQLLLGDSLAANYVICHLISNIYFRKDVMALGKCSVNISNIPSVKYPNYVEEIYEILKLLLPKSYYLPMTLDNMNDYAFIPKKDYECNRLTSGVLQLSDNTHIVMDESKLKTGQLNDSACRSLAAVSNIIKTQRAQYDFQYYKMEYDCDIPFLILSEGKSLLPSDYHVPLEPDEHCLNTFQEIQQAARQFLNVQLLNKIRVYLTLARNSKYEIAENILELVQNEFVEMRQVDKITPDDLHQLLVLARLICLSHGKLNLDDECWKQACRMEKERKIRIAKRVPRT